MKSLVQLSVLFLLLALNKQSIAQKKPCLHPMIIKGIVEDESDGQPLYMATVWNRRSHAILYTDKLGRFTIKACQGDRLEFSCTSYFSVVIKTVTSNLPLYIRLVPPTSHKKVH